MYKVLRAKPNVCNEDIVLSGEMRMISFNLPRKDVDVEKCLNIYGLLKAPCEMACLNTKVVP